MKQIKVWIDRGDGWELLHEGPERIKVELDPKDREASQIECYLFDPQCCDKADQVRLWSYQRDRDSG